MILRNKKAMTFNKLHIAGIIPLTELETKIKTDFPAHCLQIGKRLTVIEYTLAEAAYIGCKSIWLICNDANVSFVKNKIGDWVRPELTEGRTSDEIPVFYIPIKPKHYELRKCLAWNILYGSTVATYIMNNISKWMTPDKFYVTFPFTLYDYSKVILSSFHKRYLCEYNLYLRTPKGKTIKDGVRIGFTFDPFQSERYKKVLEQYVKRYKINMLNNNEKKNFFEYFDVGLEKIFGYDKIHINDLIGRVPWFYKLNTWESYVDFLKKRGKELKISGKLFDGDRRFERSE